MIELSLGACHAADEVLARIAEERLPIRVAYDLARIARRVNEEAKEFARLRAMLFEEYGDPVANGQPGDVLVPAARMKEFTAKVNEAAAIVATLDVRPIAVSLLVVKRVVEIDGKNVLLEEPAATPRELLILGELVMEG